MSAQSMIINMPLTLEQLLAAIRQLNRPARVQVVRVLIETETELDAQLDDLIQRLAKREPADDITDEMINAEIRVVREARRAR